MTNVCPRYIYIYIDLSTAHVQYNSRGSPLRIIQISRNNSTPTASVGALRRDHRVRADEHVRHALHVGAVQIKPRGREDPDRVLLAVSAAAAVVVEERPDTPAVQEEVRGSPDALEERHAALGIARRAVREVRVAVDQVIRPMERARDRCPGPASTASHSAAVR